MKSWLIFILFLPSIAWSRTVSLQDIREADLNRLRRDLPVLFTANATLATVDQAIRLLVETGNYENVFAVQKGSRTQLIGKPLRLVESIEFNGERAVDDDDLLALMELRVGERFDRKKAVSSAEKMKVYYSERGFFSTVIEINFNRTPQGHMALVYNVKENTPCRIASVDFDTVNTDLKAKLVGRFRRMRGRTLTVERVQRIMSNLNDTLIGSRYLAAEVSGPEVRYNKEKTEAILQFTVREPYRWEFYFSGFQFETQTQIYQAVDLGNRERKNVDPAGEAVERLRRHYIKSGFPHVQIETDVVNPPETYLKRVYFKIAEGPRVRMVDLEVQGRISREASYYRDFIMNNSSDLVKRGYFVREDLEVGFKNLGTELRNQGYLRARVLSSRVEYNEKQDKATVSVLLEEGPQTQIRALDFDGNQFFTDIDLAKVLELGANSPLRLNQFELAIEKLKNHYRNSGFLEMRLLNEGQELIQYNDTGTQARILFRIFEGPQIKVRSVAVEGNTFTRAKVVRKEADFTVGEILTPEKIEEATARLTRMGLFSRVDIRTLEEGTNVSQRTVVISIGERDPGMFRFGGGVNNERRLTVRGFTGLSYSNLWGTGRGVSGRFELQSNVAQVKYPEYEANAAYLEPFLFNTRTRGRVSLTRAERVYEFNTQEGYTYITTSNRLDFFAERDLSSRTKLTWKLWGLESRKDFERDGRCITKLASDFDPNMYCLPVVRQIGTIGPALDIDYTDNRFSPTTGSSIRLTADYASKSLASTPGIEFVRVDGSYSYYLPLTGPRFVWAQSVRGGYVSNLSDRSGSGVPSSYAFILGGVYSVRGFDSSINTNERIPSNYEFPFEPGALIIKSDSHYYLYKSELRFPIYGEHGGVVFYDGGSVRISGYDFDRPYRDAIGFGYRYNTPVGPLSIDFAFKINPHEDEKRKESAWRFHFWFGTF